MEADCEALSRFLTPGEAGCIRARLTHMRRYWEELKESAEQLKGQLNQNASYRQKYNDNLEQVFYKHNMIIKVLSLGTFGPFL